MPLRGLCDQFEYCIVIAAAGRGVVARGRHGAGGPGQALRAPALAQPPDRNCELEPSARTFGRRWRIVVIVIVRTVATVGVGVAVN
jgi:hypothetical protein